MRRISKALAAAALASAAIAGPLAASAQATTSTGGPLVNVVVTDVLSGNQIVLLQNVDVAVAAVVCGVEADVLFSDLATKDVAVCPSKNSTLQHAAVLWS